MTDLRDDHARGFSLRNTLMLAPVSFIGALWTGAAVTRPALLIVLIPWLCWMTLVVPVKLTVGRKQLKVRYLFRETSVPFAEIKSLRLWRGFAFLRGGPPARLCVLLAPVGVYTFADELERHGIPIYNPFGFKPRRRSRPL